MFPRKIKVCDAFGIPVYVDFSLIFLLLIFATDFGSFSFGLACALMLVLSITAHELGHALTARVFGFGTRDITLSLLGGCASLVSLPRKAWQEFFTAIAGPAVSFALSGLAWLALAVLPIGNAFTYNVLLYFMWMNVMLGGFNLLPGFPMDGGRIFRSTMRAFMSRAKATYVAMVVGRVFAVLLGLSGLQAVLSGGPWGFVRILIAWMIWREGWREYQLACFEEHSRGWGDWSARVSPPPYGGDDDEVEIRKN
jgi:Zn-dependent protease